ncbi:hypothetical protein [Pseudomonas matsuisoli]|uniref:Uncharacterized protein n=1 Tax=Pseudomonas matsuisoli TaxID=1515666 RepID=A0A917PMB8_9PSED|nr:hypothetical protein [Pseudomonas matsuisoli]GGJ84895.1 hypothetical protein GCM10009304_08590 [Pseudomonas matsuisoli]
MKSPMRQHETTVFLPCATYRQIATDGTWERQTVFGALGSIESGSVERCERSMYPINGNGNRLAGTTSKEILILR